MAKTKIVVIQLKEIIYTAIFAALGILLILLLITMFWPDKKESVTTSENTLYTPGKWNSSISLNDMALNLEVVVDKDHINSVKIINIDESITTMYPLVEPSLEAIAVQLYDDVPIDQVELSDDSKYTQTLLIEAIKMALEKAQITE
ncbi:MAG: putative rane protein [Herbinix sp.]|nr:putative rane protein [Herbinix sp.]